MSDEAAASPSQTTHRPTLATLLGAAGDAHDDLLLTGLTADSRAVAPGFLFVAIPGTQADGARFIPDAVARGARAVAGEGERPADAIERHRLSPRGRRPPHARPRCGQVLPGAAARHRRRDGDCGEEFCRRFRAPDSRASGRACRQHRDAGRGHLRRRSLWIADDARPDGAAPHALRDRPLRHRACGAGGVLARDRPAPARRGAPQRRRLYQSRPRSPRLSPDDGRLPCGQDAAVRGASSGGASRRS
jgi:hypothetical protein